ncbi:MAG: TlpA family protein disulfide reductase, partial [Bacteroidia bacterium]|nr:TlpA family protein disulfide reductase [Bacteroidia bacterium]
AENQLMTSYTNSMGMISQSIGMYFRQQLQDTTALKQIFKTQLDTQNQFEKAAAGTIALTYIKANKPYIPEGYEDLKTYINNLRLHFFDHVDFNNEILQSSNFLIERVLNYVFGMTNTGETETEIYINNINEISEVLKPINPDIKLYLYQVLWQQLVDAELEITANHVVDSELLELAKTQQATEFVEQLESYRFTAIGSVAPDFSFEIEDKGMLTKFSLLELNESENYVLVFWSSTCGHCLKELPELHNMMQTFTKEQMQVIAIGLEDEEFRWKSETYNFPLFKHVIGLRKWDNPIGNSYNVNATPAYFVLDKDKKIIAKPYDYSALRKYLADQSFED